MKFLQYCWYMLPIGCVYKSCACSANILNMQGSRHTLYAGKVFIILVYVNLWVKIMWQSFTLRIIWISLPFVLLSTNPAVQIVGSTLSLDLYPYNISCQYVMIRCQPFRCLAMSMHASWISFIKHHCIRNSYSYPVYLFSFHGLSVLDWAALDDFTFLL